MLETLKKWQEKIDARVIRERAMIFLCFLAAIFMLWNFTIQSSIDQKTDGLKSQLAAIDAQKNTLQTQISTITQNLLNDPDKSKKEQITQLESDIAGQEAQLQSISQSLIKADQLPQALQEVLQKTSQLTLLEVNTLPTVELQLVQSGPTPANQINNGPDAQSAGVYLHAVELRVSGSYAQVVQLVTALEQLPWRFYWQTLDYKVEHYPTAEISLRVYTLSSEEGLLGV